MHAGMEEEEEEDEGWVGWVCWRGGGEHLLPGRAGGWLCLAVLAEAVVVAENW